MKANVIFAEVKNNVGFDYENYQYETIKDNMTELGKWEFDDKKKARRFIYKSLQQLRLKVKGDAPTEMQFLLKDNKFTQENSQMEDKTTGNAWLDTKDNKTFIICRQEIKPEKPAKDETPKDETPAEPATDVEVAPTAEVAPEPETPEEKPTEDVMLPAPAVVDPIAELFGEVGKEIATTKKAKKSRKK